MGDRFCPLVVCHSQCLVPVTCTKLQLCFVPEIYCVLLLLLSELLIIIQTNLVFLFILPSTQFFPFHKHSTAPILLSSLTITRLLSYWCDPLIYSYVSPLADPPCSDCTGAPFLFPSFAIQLLTGVYCPAYTILT